MKMSKNIFLLAFLYFIQGLPYGLQARFLPIYLRTRGMSLTSVGLFKLLLVPWMCKALWAPFVDRLGTKKSWLLWSLAGLVVTCAVGSLLEPRELLKLGILMLVLNVITSTQDIAVDGLAIYILSSSELALGNVAQVVGYKFGAIMGGGVFLWLSNYITWSMLFWCLSFTYALAVVLAYCQVNTQSVYVGDKQSAGRDDDSRNADRTTKTSVHVSGIITSVLQHLSDIFGTEGTVWIGVFVILYKLGEVSALNMLPLFLVDHGVSSSQVGFWTGVAGQGFSIAGSLLGGWLISGSRFSPVQVTMFSCSVRVILVGSQTLIVLAWSDALPAFSLGVTSLFVMSVCSMSCLLLVSGVVTTATFTMMMQCSQRAPAHVQASHYTTLATLEVMGKLSFSVVTGSAADTFGYPFVFSLFTLLSILVLILYNFCPAIVRHSTLHKNH